MGTTFTAYIALGSNLGDRAVLIREAVRRLAADPGVLEVELSPLIETAAVGGPPGQGAYLNAAARLRTTHAPQSLLQLLQRIETELGRVRLQRWGPRTIDLDLLLYEDRVIRTPTLVVPHPRMHERRFVLEPLSAIAAGAVHPVTGRTIQALLADLSGEAPGQLPAGSDESRSAGADDFDPRT